MHHLAGAGSGGGGTPAAPEAAAPAGVDDAAAAPRDSNRAAKLVLSDRGFCWRSPAPSKLDLLHVASAIWSADTGSDTASDSLLHTSPVLQSCTTVDAVRRRRLWRP